MAHQERRRLAAIMFTDIVGYSAIMQQDERKGRTIRRRHKEVFEACSEKYEGEIIQYFGDGTLSVFDSAVSAVECAICMQKMLQEAPNVPLRIGIHLGDIHYDATDVYGHGVNVAARIEPVCHPGGIFISHKVYDEIKNHPQLRAKSLGTFKFKNISNEIGLYSVQAKGLPVPDRETIKYIRHLTAKDNMSSAALKSEAIQKYNKRIASKKRSGKLRWSIVSAILLLAVLGFAIFQDAIIPAKSRDGRLGLAVLPFMDMSGTKENEYFSDGMTEDILSLLSRIEGFRVTSRTSAMQYKDTDKKTPQIARELNVEYLLEGSVRREGDHVRITAQLIDAENDTHIWAKTYDEELTSIFDVQSQVAKDISHQLKKELSPAEQVALDAKPTKNFTAYDYYLKGRKEYSMYERENNEKAIALFEEALEIDPGYAYAWAGLGDAYAQKAYAFDQNMALLDSSIYYSQQAISKDPELSDGYKSLGLAYHYKGEWDKALDQYRKAIALNPYNDAAANNIGSIYMQQGNFIEGAKWAQKTLEINKNVPWTIMNLAKIYFEIGDYAQAESIVREGLETNPDFTELSILEAEIEIRKGNFDAAQRIARSVIRSQPEKYYGHMLLGEAFLYDNDWNSAREQYQISLDMLGDKHPEQAAMLASLKAFAEFKMGLGEKTEEVWTKAIRTIDAGGKSAMGKEKQAMCLYKGGIYAVMGKHEKAIECLESAKAHLWLDYREGLQHPAFQDLRQYPEFNHLMEEVKRKSDSVRTEVQLLESQAAIF